MSTLVMFETNSGYGPWADRMQSFDLEQRLDSSAMDLFRRVPSGTARLDNTAWAVERLPVLRQNLLAVANAGVRVVIGTDTGIPGVLPGIATQLEMVMHVEAGLSPGATLRAATTNAASVVGAAGEFGTLAPGAAADLLLLDADPRDDIANVRRIRHVIRAGRLIK
jgi:imidazolonepropionase-like amidohydrolase